MSLTIDILDKLKEQTQEFDKPPVQKVAINLEENILKGLSGSSKAQPTQGENVSPTAGVNAKTENPGKGRS